MTTGDRTVPPCDRGERRALIQQALASTVHVTAVTEWPPLFRVFPEDLPVWLELVDAQQLVLMSRSDGKVIVDALGAYEGRVVQVSAAVDVVSGVEVPPAGSRESVRISVAEVWRLMAPAEVA